MPGEAGNTAKRASTDMDPSPNKGQPKKINPPTKTIYTKTNYAQANDDLKKLRELYEEALLDKEIVLKQKEELENQNNILTEELAKEKSADKENLDVYIDEENPLNEIINTANAPDNNMEIQETAQPESNTKSKNPKFDHVLMIKNIDTMNYNTSFKIMAELDHYKLSDLAIEQAFVNRHNKYLYICTNDKSSFDIMSKNWPKDSFGGSTEVVEPSKKVKRFFVAILGVETTIDVEKMKNSLNFAHKLALRKCGA